MAERIIDILGSDFINMIKILKCFVYKDTNELISERSQHIEIKVANGMIVAYSACHVGVARYMVPVSYIGEGYSMFIKVPKILPDKSDYVTIKLVEPDNASYDAESEFADFGEVQLSFANVTFKYPQNHMKKNKVDFESVFNQVDKPYQLSKRLDNDIRSNNVRVEPGGAVKCSKKNELGESDKPDNLDKPDEDIKQHSNMVRPAIMSRVKLSTKHLFKVISALNSVEKVGFEMEAETTYNRAIRLSTRAATIYLMPMRIHS